MKTLVAVPCMDSIDTDFVRCITEFQKHNPDVDIRFHANSMIYVARDSLCAIAIDEGYDYILFLDSDMVFKPDLLEKLMASDKDLVAGIFFRRRNPFTPAIWKKIRLGNVEDRIIETYDDYPQDRLFEIDACGMAAVLMKVKMLEDIWDHDGTIFTPYSGYGEDVTGCLRAKKLGYKLYCDSRVKVGHKAQTVVTEDTFQALKRTRERAKEKQTDVFDCN